MDALNPLVKLFQNRTFVTFLLSAVVAVLVGLIPTLAPYQEQIISVGVALVLLSAGGEVIQGVAKTNADAKVLVAQATPQTALLAGAAPLQPFAAHSEFTDTELRAIAYKFGTLPPGDVSRESLVYRIINAVSVPTP